MRLWSGKPSFASRWSDGAGAVGSGGLRYEATDPRHGHVEAWALSASDPRAGRALSLRWSVWAGERDPRRALAEVWAVAFGTREGHVATKVSVPFERGSFQRGALGVAVDGVTLTEGAARGRVESGGRAIAYDLEVRAAHAMPVSWPSAARSTALLPDARVNGVVVVEGEAWPVDDWSASLWHRWGRAHADDQAWGHCNAWDDGDDLVLEGTTWRPRVGLLSLPARTGIAVRVGGETLRMRASASPVRASQAEGSVTPRRWRFVGRSPRLEVEGEMWADSEDFVGLFCANPDGTTVHCLDTKVACAEVTLRVPGRPARTLRSRRASLEIATRDPHHGVRMHV